MLFKRRMEQLHIGIYFFIKGIWPFEVANPESFSQTNIDLCIALSQTLVGL